MVSRVLGLGRDILMAAFLGTGPVAQAFLIAFTLPNMFRRFFAEGAFNLAFVPLFAKKVEAGEDAEGFARDALSGLGFVLVVFVVLGWLAMPWLVLAMASGFAGMAGGRIVTGVGIGGMTATAGMLALEYASQNRREFAASAVASAYPVGTIIGAYVAVAVLDGYGWRGIFWVGAALSAVLLPVAWVSLAESLDFLLIRQPRGALAKTNRILRRVSVPEIAVLPPKPEGLRTWLVDEIFTWFHLRELLKLFSVDSLYPIFLAGGQGMYKAFPADYRAELEAVAKAS